MLRLANMIGLAIAGIINLLPVSGALGLSWLKALYGFDIASADLEILLRHRALLFGIVGLLLLISIVKPAFRGVAVLIGLASMSSFIVVALVVGGYGPAINKIILADILGIAALMPTAFNALFSSSRSE
jgi:hypothetical protein